MNVSENELRNMEMEVAVVCFRAVQKGGAVKILITARLKKKKRVRNTGVRYLTG